MQILHLKHGKLSNHLIAQNRIGIQNNNEFSKTKKHFFKIRTLMENDLINANLIFHSRFIHDLQYSLNPKL